MQHMLSCYYNSIVFFFMKTSQNKLKEVHIATSKVHNPFNFRS
jgi:DUF1365 family protein